MSKIYDALRRAEAAQEKAEQSSLDEAEEKVSSPGPGAEAPAPAESEDVVPRASDPTAEPPKKARQIQSPRLQGKPDSYHQLLQGLGSLNDQEGGKIVLVSSALPGEGKSYLARNLAACLLEAGKSVVLVDADLQQAEQHREFEVELSPGLTDLAAGARALEEVLYLNSGLTFGFIAAGAEKGGGPPFSRAGFLPLLDLLRSHADWVIFDGGPANTSAETRRLAGQVDGVLLVVRAGKTRWEAVQRAHELLLQAQANVLGAVLNRNPSRA